MEIKAEYLLSLNGEQARVLVEALDLYARVQAGQFDRIADYTGRIFRSDVPANDIQHIRDYMRSAMSLLFRMDEHWQGFGIRSEEVPDSARVAFDILQVVRHGMWQVRHRCDSRTTQYTVDAFDPHRTSQKISLPDLAILLEGS